MAKKMNWALDPYNRRPAPVKTPRTKQTKSPTSKDKE